MSSAAVLGREWSFCPDSDVVSISFVNLEKHSRPGNIRSNISLDNGLPRLQVKIFNAYLIILITCHLDCYHNASLLG